MSAREEILGRVRRALTDVQDKDPISDVEVKWVYEQPTPMEDVLDKFCERVADYKATVIRLEDGSDEAIGEAIVEGLESIGVRDVVLPSGVPGPWREAVAAAGIEIKSDEPRLTNEQLNGTGAVVTGARVGAAESGTIMLDHAEDQGRRALTLVPDAHICVVRTEQVVSDVPEAVGRLAGSAKDRRPMTWISGPSATSDIELSRVEGVHGPRTLYVIVAGS